MNSPQPLFDITPDMRAAYNAACRNGESHQAWLVDEALNALVRHPDFLHQLRDLMLSCVPGPSALRQPAWDDCRDTTVEYIEERISDAAQGQVPISSMAQSAARWRALISCARIRHIGSAGLSGPTDPYGKPWNGFAHLGLELWTRNPYPEDKSPQDGARWLTHFVDVAISGNNPDAPPE